jgi:hypothetical protein
MFGKRRKTQPLSSRQRVPLSTGGFVEIEPSYQGVPDSGYVRIHLGIPENAHDLDETFKYVRHGYNADNFKLLLELRDAIDTLVRNNPQCQRKIRRLPEQRII